LNHNSVRTAQVVLLITILAEEFLPEVKQAFEQKMRVLPHSAYSLTSLLNIFKSASQQQLDTGVRGPNTPTLLDLTTA
jgi:hypothetical protein